MASPNVLPDWLMERYRQNGRLGGLARKRAMSKTERKASARKAGIASGKARRK